jgi:hypothetical protein
MERPLADRGDEVRDYRVAHLLGIDPVGAGIAGEAGKTEMRAPFRKLRHQTSPCRCHRHPRRPLHGLQPTELHRGEEARAEVGECLRADPDRDRVDRRQLAADHRQLEGDAGGLLTQQAGDALQRRAQIPEPGRGDRVVVLQAGEDVGQAGRSGGIGGATEALRVTFDRHELVLSGS